MGCTNVISMAAVVPDPCEQEWERVTVDGLEIILKDWKAWMFHAYKVLKGEKAAIEKMYFAFGPELSEAREKRKRTEEIKNAYSLGTVSESVTLLR